LGRPGPRSAAGGAPWLRSDKERDKADKRHEEQAYQCPEQGLAGEILGQRRAPRVIRFHKALPQRGRNEIPVAERPQRIYLPGVGCPKGRCRDKAVACRKVPRWGPGTRTAGVPRPGPPEVDRRCVQGRGDLPGRLCHIGRANHQGTETVSTNLDVVGGGLWDRGPLQYRAGRDIGRPVRRADQARRTRWSAAEIDQH
jgi:hypothetical protein